MADWEQSRSLKHQDYREKFSGALPNGGKRVIDLPKDWRNKKRGTVNGPPPEPLERRVLIRHKERIREM